MEGFTDPRNIYGTGHGHNVFQVHLLVPLVFAGAGIRAGAIDANVSLVDVAPTILQAVGVEAPAADGHSLLEPPDEGRPILAEAIAYGHEKRSVVHFDRKLLSAPGDGYERVFGLGADRRESEVVTDPSEVERLRRFLPEGPGAVGEQVASTEEIERHLRDLGYIE
jgi:arylsulfatase A-like enzyme